MRERTSLRRLALAIAVLAAVAVRLLTPAGWMPNPGGAGGSLLIICTGEGPRVAGGLDLPGQGPGHTAPRDHCLFSGFSLAGSPGPAFTPTPRVSLAPSTAKPVVPEMSWSARDQYRQQLPRGPPQEV